MLGLIQRKQFKNLIVKKKFSLAMFFLKRLDMLTVENEIKKHHQNKDKTQYQHNELSKNNYAIVKKETIDSQDITSSNTFKRFFLNSRFKQPYQNLLTWGTFCLIQNKPAITLTSANGAASGAENCISRRRLASHRNRFYLRNHNA